MVPSEAGGSLGDPGTYMHDLWSMAEARPWSRAPPRRIDTIQKLRQGFYSYFMAQLRFSVKP